MNNHEPGGTGERSRRTSAWVVETTRETFEADVWERSEQVPIVVDFWAPWCAPCRALGPVLERLAGEYEGKFELVKVNMDEVPEAAAQFQVQSIPMVVGLRHREVVDFFVGALPESHLRAFLDRIVPSAAERLVLEARLLQETEPDGAIQRLRQAMELEPNQSAATIACGQLLVDLGRYEEAAEIVEQLEGRGFLEPEAQRVQAAVQRHQQGAEAGDVAACREALAAEPDNPQLSLHLAQALAAEESFEESLQLALRLVQSDRQRTGESARQLMVDIFHILPDDSDLTAEYRRKLAAALF